MRPVVFSGLMMVACIGSLVFAQQIVKSEPPVGSLSAGSYVYLDDGKCPKGQIMKVSAGKLAGHNKNGNGVAQGRLRECVARP